MRKKRQEEQRERGKKKKGNVTAIWDRFWKEKDSGFFLSSLLSNFFFFTKYLSLSFSLTGVCVLWGCLVVEFAGEWGWGVSD